MGIGSVWCTAGRRLACQRLVSGWFAVNLNYQYNWQSIVSFRIVVGMWPKHEHAPPHYQMMCNLTWWWQCYDDDDDIVMMMIMMMLILLLSIIWFPKLYTYYSDAKHSDASVRMRVILWRGWPTVTSLGNSRLCLKTRIYRNGLQHESHTCALPRQFVKQTNY
jgi:hypothetical protein